jgi:hypothetical protein
MSNRTRYPTRTYLPAVLAAGLFAAGASLPAVADMGAADTGATSSVTRAPHKTGNRFHHRNVTRETAEFARLEAAGEDAGRDLRR